MNEVFRVLNLISVESLYLLRKRSLKLLPETRNHYLGRWDRVEVDKSHFALIADEQILAPMSVEIIRAFDDMSGHLHHHEHADAVITVLGTEEGFEEPVGCSVYFKSREPFPASAGMTLQVPRGTVHSFSGGKTPVAFLSVQSNKIDEDYHIAG